MNNAQPERRAVARNRTMKKGTVVFGNRYCSTDCSVRNESPFGAMLKVYQNHVVPSEIEVSIYPSTTLRPAEIVWRTPEMVGIKYLDVEEGAAPQIPDDVRKEDVILEENRIAPQKADEEALSSMRREAPYNPVEDIKEPQRAENAAALSKPKPMLGAEDILPRAKMPTQRQKTRGFGRRKLD